MTFLVADAVLVLSILGLFLLVVALVVDGARRERAEVRQLPRPYPGCPACWLAAADDVSDGLGRRLELHQLADHTGGVRW